MSRKSRTSFVTCFALFFFLISPVVISEEAKSLPERRYSVFYKVENLITKDTMTQEYEFEIYSKPEPHYKLKIKNVASKEIISTEVQAAWNKITLLPGRQYYTDLGLTENISSIHEDARFFGRIEVKSVYDHRVINAWPVFGTVEKRTEMFVATLTVHLVDGQKMIITDLYGKNLYHVPVYRRSLFLNKEGQTVSDIQFTLL
jgi:hypothetical protein